MPILTNGSNITLTVAAGQILTVQSDQATFDFENPVGTRVGEYAADAVFGPFASGGSVKITSVQGPLFYELATPPVATRTPYLLAQTGVPTVLPSSGSSNASGQITLTTALGYQPTGTVGLYLPAGVVTAGSQGSGAGVYQVTFSSTTVCQITGTGIVTANASYTQTTASVQLATVVIPAGAMGANGMLRIAPHWGANNNANNRTFSLTLAGSTVAAWTEASITMDTRDVRVRNRGTQSAQISTNWSAYANTTASQILTSADTSQQQTLAVLSALSVATDYNILEGLTVELLPSN